jgi:hypothetical protein
LGLCLAGLDETGGLAAAAVAVLLGAGATLGAVDSAGGDLAARVTGFSTGRAAGATDGLLMLRRSTGVVVTGAGVRSITGAGVLVEPQPVPATSPSKKTSDSGTRRGYGPVRLNVSLLLPTGRN